MRSAVICVGVMFFKPDYIERELIYESPQSLVWRAKRASDGVFVAIKQRRNDPNGQSRLEREAAMLGLCEGSNIVRLVECAGEGAACGLVTRFIEKGITLASLIENESLSASSCLEIGIAVARALAIIHRNGIVHRDIKPGNIVCTPALDRIVVIDFGIATRGHIDRSTHVAVSAIEGSLAYVAPEQTGRMNRATDYRSDYYALGATLYQLLSGELPFSESDPSKLIYAHLARTPAPLSSLKKTLSPAISKVVAKLLEKDPDRRYQSSFGLLHDLEACLREYHDDQFNPSFAAGTLDRSERFQLSTRLVGRATQARELRLALQRTSPTHGVCVALAGVSGIGKSALVAATYVDLQARGGGVLSGKFDQQKRAIAYSAVLQALQSGLQLLRDNAAEPDSLDLNSLASRVGAHFSLLARYFPEVDALASLDRSSLDLPERDRRVLLGPTIAAVCRELAAEFGPLVVFLDDIQWADSASLDLIRRITCDDPIGNLFLITAHRSNEVGLDHPISSLLSHMRSRGIDLREIELGPLEIDATVELVQASLHDAPMATELAGFLHRRTAGNPFFVGQVLLALASTGHLWIDPDSGAWAWDRVSLAELADNDDVASLLVGRINTFSYSTRNALAMAALLGATFSLPLLAHVLEQSVDSVRTALEPAAKAGFLAAVCDPQAGVGTQDAPWHLSEPERGPTWRFYHDRLQYAALDLLGDTKVKACETIARRLIDGSARDHSSKLVELVAFYTSQCVQAFCNLRDANTAFDYVYRAAREAIETAAYDIALTYVATARMLHEHTSDANHESLAFELELLQCTALRPLGQLDVAREKLALLRSRAADLDAYNRCAALEIDCATVAGDNAGTIALIIKLFARQGLILSEHPNKLRAAWSYLAMRRMASKSAIARFVQAPSQPSSTWATFADAALPGMTAVYHLGDMQLYLVVLEHTTRAAIRAGHHATAAHALSIVSVLLSAGQHDFVAAAGVIDRCQVLLAREPSPRREAFVEINRALFVSVWLEGFESCRAVLRRTHELAACVGELWPAAMALAFDAVVALFDGTRLSITQQAVIRSRNFARDVKEWSIVPFSDLQLQLCRILSGESNSNPRTRLVFANLTAEQSIDTLIYQCDALQLMHAVFFRDLERAWLECLQLSAREQAGSGMPSSILVTTLRGLVGAHFQYVPERRKQAKQWIAASDQMLQRWAQHVPDSAKALQALLATAMAVGQDPQAALGHADRCIRLSQRAGLWLFSGLAAHMAMEACSLDDNAHGVRFYFQHVNTSYDQWGAGGLLQYVERSSRTSLPTTMSLRAMASVEPREFSPPLSLGIRTMTGSISAETLDAMKIARGVLALSRENDLSSMLDIFIRLAMEVAGARLGALYRLEEDISEAAHQPLNLLVSARLNGTQIEIERGENGEIHSRNHAPQLRSILEIVRKSKIAHYADSFSESADAQQNAGSLLAVPVLRTNECVALLILENDSAADAFGQAQRDAITIIAAQIGLGLEHAQLVERLNRSNTLLESKNRDLGHALAEAQTASRAKAVFLANMSHELRTPLNGVLGMSELLRDTHLDEEQSAMLQAIRSSGEAILSAISAILDLAELETGDVVQRPREFELGEFLDSLVERARTESAGQETSVEFRSEVDRPCWVLADRQRLQRIIGAVLDNAVKFTKGGSIRMRAAFDPESPNSRLEIEIRDTGCGIEPRKRDELFREFSQGDASSTKKFRGLGVGLAMVRRSLQILGGQIQLESELGVGTRVRIWCPIEYRGHVALSQRQTPRATGLSQSGDVVLVVEDDRINQRLLVRMVERLGYTTIVANNGLEALHAFRNEPQSIRVILMDCQMPIMDGYEAAASIRAHERLYQLERTPIVAVTANALSSDRERCLGAGMDEFVSKPIAIDDLRTRFAGLGITKQTICVVEQRHDKAV